MNNRALSTGCGAVLEVKIFCCNVQGVINKQPTMFIYMYI